MARTKKYVLPLFSILFGIVSIALTTWVITSTQSAKASDSFNAENIISDYMFTNKDSMSVGQIQNFLESKGSACLANFQTLSLNDQNGDGLGDEPYGKGVGEQVSAATVIWQAAQLYRINPQVILATLQKEQGLVTRQDCPSWRYNTALGYGCPDSEPCDVAAYGFTRQIDYGVWHFRGFFDDTYPVPPTVPGSKFIAYNPDGGCGGSVLNIQNRATAALYSYTPYQPNAAALATPQGQLVDCGAYGNLNFWRYFTSWFGSTQYEPVYMTYKSHISYYGWTETNINRGMTGFTGQGKPMEAFKIDGEVEYSSYNFTTGWQPTINAGMISGTTGQNKPIQAVKIAPTGTLATKFDIYYRAHVSYVGWMGWAKNGEPAGVTGDVTKNIEAFEIQLIPKGASAPGPTTSAYQNITTTTNNSPLTFTVDSHVGGVGWQPSVTDNMVTGVTEQNRRIEALKIGMTNQTGLAGNLLYSAHVSGIGWQDFKQQNEVAGTTGQFRQMEAVRIAFTGQLAESYDVWYRGYVQYKGWLNWAKNGAPAGSVGASLQLEAIEIRITPKNSVNLEQRNNLYNPRGIPDPDSYTLSYSSHVGYVGWMTSVPQSTVNGTTGQSHYIEALRIDSSSSLYGDVGVICAVYIKDTGWLEGITNGSICGTVGQKKSIEAVKLGLTGSAANKYDIYYRPHLSWIGWQNWAKNGEAAGTPNSNNLVEAIIIKLVEK
jgi:uncharacterized protein YjdB